LRELAADPEEPVAAIEIRSPEGHELLRVGQRALRDGVLLGRYEDRCDGAEALQSEMISRVHLLLVEVDGRAVAVDLASTNGTRLDGAPIDRVVDLPAAGLFRLGGAAEVRWRRAGVAAAAETVVAPPAALETGALAHHLEVVRALRTSAARRRAEARAQPDLETDEQRALLRAEVIHLEVAAARKRALGLRTPAGRWQALGKALAMARASPLAATLFAADVTGVEEAMARLVTPSSP
jgi:hypothetical protein